MLNGLVEKELNDSDIPMKFVTAQNAKWIVFSIRETAEYDAIVVCYLYVVVYF